eukprot:UC4_evm4s566
MMRQAMQMSAALRSDPGMMEAMNQMMGSNGPNLPGSFPPATNASRPTEYGAPSSADEEERQLQEALRLSMQENQDQNQNKKPDSKDYNDK